jgi:hypothetical protein
MRTFVMSMLMLCFFALTSCQKKKEDPRPTDVTRQEVLNSMTSGIWRISLYNDSGTDKTNDYSGYTITFNSNGTVIAQKGVESISGTWSITDSNSNDDSLKDMDFNLNFSSNATWVELNDDWDFKSHTGVKVELQDVSGGNRGTDLLTFKKN